MSDSLMTLGGQTQGEVLDVVVKPVLRWTGSVQMVIWQWRSTHPEQLFDAVGIHERYRHHEQALSPASEVEYQVG
jgi:hypothetical protein